MSTQTQAHAYSVDELKLFKEIKEGELLKQMKNYPLFIESIY
jgi:hypothetical protein